MYCLTNLRSFFANMTKVVLELSGRIESLLAFIALITPCIWEGTIGACANNESISQPKITIRAIALCHFLLGGFIFIVNIQKDLLGDFRVPFSACSTEIVEPDIEPLVDLCMNFIIEIADLLRSLLLFHRFHFRCCTVFISPANIEHVAALEFLEAREDISWQHAADDVTEMWHIVYIWQCGSDQDVVLIFSREASVGLKDDLLSCKLFFILLWDFNFFLLASTLPLCFHFRLCLFGSCCFLGLFFFS